MVAATTTARGLSKACPPELVRLVVCRGSKYDLFEYAILMKELLVRNFEVVFSDMFSFNQDPWMIAFCG
jgi:hypothetical protein